MPRVPEITHTWFGPLWSHELNCFRLPMSPSRSGMLVQPSLIPMLVAGDLFCVVMCYLRPLYTMPVVPKITHTRNLRQNRVNYRVNWWGRTRETLHVYSTQVFTLPFIHILCGYNLWVGQQKIEHAYRPRIMSRVPKITHARNLRQNRVERVRKDKGNTSYILHTGIYTSFHTY